MKTDLRSLTYDEVEKILTSMGEAKFRVRQLYPAVFKYDSLDEITTLSKALREKLSQDYFIDALNVAQKQVSKKDGTVKFLFRLSDGNFIESVFMKYHHGNTLCVSSQVGCLMGCKFCASTIGGKVRDLTSGEIISQIIAAQKETNERVSNIVMMGIGEPLDNFLNVVKFLEIVNDENTLNIGLRHISLSTCGIVPKIYELSELNLPITLSVSLHAPFDNMRTEIMPVNKKYPLDELVRAMRDYIKKTNRRISIEYALIEGKNDTKECAKELLRLFSRGLFHINLIPVNNVRERDFKKTSQKASKEFAAILNAGGLTATIRRELGSDIDAACGQLRRKQEQNK